MTITNIIDTLELLYDSFGYLIVYFASLIETTPFGWTIPGGLLTALGGFFAYDNNQINIVGIFLAGWLGMLTTLIGGYYFGSKTGTKLEKKFKQENNVKRAKLLLEKHGAVILTASMLANLTRFWIAYVAGNSKYNKRKFLLYALSASFTWTLLLVAIGYIAGTSRSKLESGLAHLGIFAWVLVIGLTIFLSWKIKQEYEELKEV